MDIFEYLPQLIVAYDGNDEFANLIHVKKADRDKDYYCPCCGGTVKPRALDSNKEQSHYYHKTGKCTKESQLHFFCKTWLFETGSNFYIDDELFEVTSIEIEKSYFTPFGDYKPDITVYTINGKTIYFEMFFTNRKTGDDYFCKWESLGNDVVEVNIKEFFCHGTISDNDNKTFLKHLFDSDTNTVYTHPTTSGNKHIPSGGSSGQILKWASDGTVAWGTENDHDHSASDITAGTFSGNVVAPASTEYTTNMIRNGVITTTDPGENASVSYSNGSLIFVHE